MEWILTELIGSTIKSCDWIVDQILESLVPMAFYAEKYMTGSSTVIFSFGVALGAPVLYNWLVNVAEDMIDKMLNVSNMIITLTRPADFIWNTVSSAGLSMVVFGLILIIMYAILYFQFVTRGIEMLVLRIGTPIACVGLVDSDKGMFAPYMKKFYMNAATVLVQIVLVKLSLMVLAVSNNIIYAVAIAVVANRTPKFLGEFMLMQSGGGSITNTIYHVTRLIQMAKNAVK